eukprot:XP_025003499.1 WAS/WASL-interacting protein family member 3-like [Gallus gallus]
MVNIIGQQTYFGNQGSFSARTSEFACFHTPLSKTVFFPTFRLFIWQLPRLLPPGWGSAPVPREEGSRGRAGSPPRPPGRNPPGRTAATRVTLPACRGRWQLGGGRAAGRPRGDVAGPGRGGGAPATSDEIGGCGAGPPRLGAPAPGRSRPGPARPSRAPPALPPPVCPHGEPRHARLRPAPSPGRWMGRAQLQPPRPLSALSSPLSPRLRRLPFSCEKREVALRRYLGWSASLTSPLNMINVPSARNETFPSPDCSKEESRPTSHLPNLRSPGGHTRVITGDCANAALSKSMPITR